MARRQNLEQIRATAFHESGHAVVAFKLGIPIHSDGISTLPGEGFHGFCSILLRKGGDTFSDRIRCDAERQVMFLLAGIEAQRRYRASSIRRHHNHSDYIEAVDFLTPFSESAEEVSAWLKLLQIRTRAIIDSDTWWAVIERLARELIQRRRLSGRETKLILLQAITEV